MTAIVFTVAEKATGWFVTGADPIGPFFSKERAMDLAEGMVAALRASGEAADLVIETPSWSPPS